MVTVDFKYMSKEERDALPDSDFGYISGERRLFPIVIASDVAAAAKLIGRAKGLSEKEREGVKKRVTKIANKKGFSLPKAWEADSEMSGPGEDGTEQETDFVKIG